VRRLPDDRMVSSALNEMLQAEGLVSAASSIEVSYVVGSLRAAYHVLVPEMHTPNTSAVLARLLDRPFTSSHSGWFINGREARALIEAAHRLAKSGKR
jgi:hypothetical protein